MLLDGDVRCVVVRIELPDACECWARVRVGQSAIPASHHPKVATQPGERIGSDHNRITVRSAARQAIDSFQFTAGIRCIRVDRIGFKNLCLRRAHGDSIHSLKRLGLATRMLWGPGSLGMLYRCWRDPAMGVTDLAAV